MAESSTAPCKVELKKDLPDSGPNGHSHGHSHEAGVEHGHTHEHMDNPGDFAKRDPPLARDFKQRGFTVGIGGPVGSGKTALMLALCRHFRDEYNICAITNDIFTREDGEFLLRNEALEKNRIRAIETGGCPHAAIREDISANLAACEELTAEFNVDLILLESGGDNLAANFSRELSDYTIYVIDVAGGDKVPRKGGPGVTQSDLFIINKIDLAEAVGADLGVMDRDAKKMRGAGPTVFAQVKADVKVPEIANYIIQAWTHATGGVKSKKSKPSELVTTSTCNDSLFKLGHMQRVASSRRNQNLVSWLLLLVTIIFPSYCILHEVLYPWINKRHI